MRNILLLAGNQRAHKLDTPVSDFVQMEFCYSCFLRDQQQHPRAYFSGVWNSTQFVKAARTGRQTRMALVHRMSMGFLASTLTSRPLVQPHLPFDKNNKKQKPTKTRTFSTKIVNRVFLGCLIGSTLVGAYKRRTEGLEGTWTTCMGLSAWTRSSARGEL